MQDDGRPKTLRQALRLKVPIPACVSVALVSAPEDSKNLKADLTRKESVQAVTKKTATKEDQNCLEEEKCLINSESSLKAFPPI